MLPKVLNLKWFQVYWTSFQPLPAHRLFRWTCFVIASAALKKILIVQPLRIENCGLFSLFVLTPSSFEAAERTKYANIRPFQTCYTILYRALYWICFAVLYLAFEFKKTYMHVVPCFLFFQASASFSLPLQPVRCRIAVMPLFSRAFSTYGPNPFLR